MAGNILFFTCVTSLNFHFTHLENENNRHTHLVGSCEDVRPTWVTDPSTQLICTNDSLVHLSSSLTMALFLVRKALNWDQHPDFHSPQTSRIKATTPLTFPFKKKKNFVKKIKTWHIQRATNNSVTKESDVFKSSSLTDVTCNLLTMN